jgi:hypothetical protein
MYNAELMNRSLGYLLIAILIIGLIVSAGCIAVPGGISNQTGTTVTGSGDILPGDGSTPAGSEHLTTIATPAAEETGQVADQPTLQPDTMENQTISEENSTALQPEETLIADTTPGEVGDPNATVPVDTTPIPVATTVVTVMPTPVAVVNDPQGVLLPANPFPIEPEPTETPMLVTVERPVEEIYKEIYHENVTFSYSAKAFSYNLYMPPLIIEYTVWPEIIVDMKAYTSRFGRKEDEIVTTTYPSPSAWFEVIVRDKTNGEIVMRDGYGVNYTQDYFKRMKVLKTGNYQIDFRGNDVTADIAMRVID